MKTRIILALAIAFQLVGPVRAAEEAVTLPPDIVWETDNDEPLIGSPNAIRGDTLRVAIGAYPLTFRMMGPNSNDYFATWNRQFAAMPLVMRHPVTDVYVPVLATHWSIQKDQQTIYFKLDRDAKFSDGHPVTADDYVFTWRMMQSKFIVDPFYNSYAEQYYKSVDKIDDYTLRIVGTRASWRPLNDYAGLWPTPEHVTKLDDTWVTRTTNEPLVGPGPYVVSEQNRGESVVFKRIPNWWGDKKRYFIGLYNFDNIKLRVMSNDRELDYLRQGELDMMWEGSARNWNEGYNFDAIKNGWLRRARIFVDVPSGVSGFQINLGAPLLENRDFRLAIHHLFNFERLNRNVMYNEYFRKASFFDGTEFANPNIHARPFDPAKAHEYLEKAGFHRPEEGKTSMFASLWRGVRGLIAPRTDTDDILVNDKGEKAGFTVTYTSKTLERHLTVIQQDYRRAGVDMRLQLLEPGTAFQRALERKFEITHLGMTSGFYPDPRQYLHTDFKKTNNNNDFWGFGTQEVDDLIRVYEEDLDPEARRQAMYRIDQIVHDEGFYIPFWDAPYQRLVYWDYFQFPEFYLPKRTEQYIDWLVYWIDPVKKAALKEAMDANKPYPLDPETDKDFYGVRKKFQQ